MNQPNWDQETYIQAWDFATIQHGDQTYGGPLEGQRIPYINHLAAVAMEVIWALSFRHEMNGNLALQCALLHDTIEDTETTFEMVETRFGLNVAQGVSSLTKNDALPTKGAQMTDSLQRIRQQPPEVWMVKMADRITNLSEPPFYWPLEKRKKYLSEAKSIYDALNGAHRQLAERLSEKIRSYPQFF